MDCHERCLIGLCENQKATGENNLWTSDETEELTRLYRAKRDRGGGASFAYGETDDRDPQFYVLSTSDAEPCTACVSRFVRDSRRWLVRD
jgi:hypothetical protein